MEVLVHGQLTHYFWACGNLYICWKSWEEDSVHSFHDSKKAINMKRKGKIPVSIPKSCPKDLGLPSRSLLSNIFTTSQTYQARNGTL